MANKRKRDSSVERIEKYKKKILDLEKKQRQKRRRIIVDSSSESESDHTPEAAVSRENNRAPSQNVPEVTPESPARPSNTEADPSVNTQAVPEPAPVEAEKIDIPAVSQDEQVSNQEIPELDPELLIALGEEIGNTPNFGDKIHQMLSRRWEPILKKGLPKEVKDALLKDYLVPENCTLLQAPKLNVEVAAAISESCRSRDKRKESDQQQLGVGISAISKAMTTLLTNDDKIEAIRVLSDGCRILADLHFTETQSRISVINFALAKPFLNIVQDGERDETLYGNKLGEKIKASNAIEKQGMQIKKYTKKKVTTDPPTSARPHYQQGPPVTNQGNWSGPPRFQQNRGGRRASQRRPPAAAAPSRRPPPPSQLTSSAAGQPRSRAPRL